MKVVAVSDLHGYLPAIPECDLLVIAGDITPVRDHSHRHQAEFTTHELLPWLRKTGLPAERIIAVAGNHDFIAFEHETWQHLPWTYLQDEWVSIDGLKVHGTPWTPQFGEWAFMRDDAELAKVWEVIPDDTDLLVTHGPPRGVRDFSNMGGYNAGSVSLLARVCDVMPATVVCGHIHEARGYESMSSTNLYNVSFVDGHYRPYPLPLTEINL